jgi:hypothetical protein
MSDALDLLLELTREEHPSDDAFVSRVMAEVRVDEQRRTGRRMLRRPMVVGIAAAVLVTGGAVAAVVGTNPSEPKAPTPQVSAPAAAHEAPRATVEVTTAPKTAAAAPTSVAPGPTKIVEDASGFLTDHTAFILDAKTGLRLQTETYTNDFIAGKDHRVTLTMENTGTKPIAFSAAKDCALQVMAFPEGSNSAAVYQSPEDYSGSFEWVCAGSDADPRTQALSEDFVLQPGERRIADAYLNLRTAGEWKIGGMCRCSYTRTESVNAPAPRSNPLSELFRRAVPEPLLPEKYEGRDLVTPGIIVRAR